MRAIIYARYSSDRQREESIEDQIRVCTEWCSAHGHDVVGIYSDKAMTGRTDQRPQFLRMVEECSKADLCVVYKMDRFSRDKYDAAVYKRRMRDKGCRVVSATESVPDSPEGVLMESLLEGMAAYYSANLAQNVKRGMEGNARRCLAQGYMVFGYDIGDDGRYVINESEARIVREMFQRYADGEAVSSIKRDMDSRGVKSRKTGRVLADSTIRGILQSEKYIGVYSWGDIRIPGGMPRIIDDGLWEKARKRVPLPRGMAVGKKEKYWLAGKVYCGECGEPLHGASAHSKGRVYRYYGSRKGCPRVSAQLLEKRCAESVERLVRDPERLSDVAQSLADHMNSKIDLSAIDDLEARISDAEARKERLLDAVSEGLPYSQVADRLSALSDELASMRMSLESMRRDVVTTDPDEVMAFLRDVTTELPWEETLQAFVSRVDVYDGYAIAEFSYTKEGTSPRERVSLEEVSYDSRLVDSSASCAKPIVIGLRVFLVVPLAA